MSSWAFGYHSIIYGLSSLAVGYLHGQPNYRIGQFYRVIVVLPPSCHTRAIAIIINTRMVSLHTLSPLRPRFVAAIGCCQPYTCRRLIRACINIATPHIAAIITHAASYYRVIPPPLRIIRHWSLLLHTLRSPLGLLRHYYIPRRAVLWFCAAYGAYTLPLNMMPREEGYCIFIYAILLRLPFTTHICRHTPTHYLPREGLRHACFTIIVAVVSSHIRARFEETIQHSAIVIWLIPRHHTYYATHHWARDALHATFVITPPFVRHFTCHYLRQLAG